MSSTCPFSKSSPVSGCPMKFNNNTDQQAGSGDKIDDHNKDPVTISPKCPFGYDSHTFKLGPLSCMLCRALLYESSKCMPCSHKFCKACISRFKDCPLCGADIEKIEPDNDLQTTVDRFIDGHVRIKRSPVSTDSEEARHEPRNVIYGDVSVERGSFLVQQAMNAFHGKNVESAKSRLGICAEDIREQLQIKGNASELCSQLGAVLGMLGDCSKAMRDTESAVKYYEESVEVLSKLPTTDLELVHTLSVSLNKIGDLRYYDDDLESARTCYTRALNIRCDAIRERPNEASQIVDFAISLAKVADVDRSLGNEDGAVKGFYEAIARLESLKLDSRDVGLEQRRLSVLEFLHSQLSHKESSTP